MASQNNDVKTLFSGIASSAQIKEQQNNTYKAKLSNLEKLDSLQAGANTYESSIKRLAQQWDEYFLKNNGFAKAHLRTKLNNEPISIKISKPRFRNEFVLFEVEPKNKKNKLAITTLTEQKINQPMLSIYAKNFKNSERNNHLENGKIKIKNANQLLTDPAASSIAKSMSNSCSILFEADSLSSNIAMDSFTLPLQRTIPENAVAQQWTKGDTILGPLTLEAKTLDNAIYDEISYGLSSGKLYPKIQLQIENCNGLTGHLKFHNSVITNLKTSRFIGHTIEIHFQGMTNFGGNYLD